VTDEAGSIRPADVVHRLSGYVNGTHYRPLLERRRHDSGPSHVVDALRRLGSGSHDGVPLVLGVDKWRPSADDERQLRDGLADRLALSGIVDLVVFGSQARGSTTGFSDVDAILVIDDASAGDARALATLRPSVLAAGRAVISYQPLQHHGFLVATPRLLGYGTAAVRLPGEALATTASLFGRSVKATVGPGPDGRKGLMHLARSLASTTSWPTHAWFLHRTIATFELAPSLYLQATGRPCSKDASFAVARTEFAGAWAPFDVLEEVRRSWPRDRSPLLEGLASALRNPWTASAIRRRLPMAVSAPVRELLDDRVLHALQRLLVLMVERAG
jgi:hypothetical protein